MPIKGFFSHANCVIVTAAECTVSDFGDCEGTPTLTAVPVCISGIYLAKSEQAVITVYCDGDGEGSDDRVVIDRDVVACVNQDQMILELVNLAERVAKLVPYHGLPEPSEIISRRHSPSTAVWRSRQA